VIDMSLLEDALTDLKLYRDNLMILKHFINIMTEYKKNPIF